MKEVIDAHVHLWTRRVAERSASMRTALDYFRRDIEAVPESLDSIVEDLEGAGVKKAFLLAMDCVESEDAALRNLTVTNDEVAAAVQEHPDLFIGFGSVDPRRRDSAVREVEDAITRLELRGLKFHASTLEVYPNDPELMFPIYEKAVELDAPIIHHSGTTALGNCRIEYAQPLFFDEVSEAFPDLRLLLAHFGWPWMEECFAVLMRHENLYTDVSGWSPRHVPERAIRMFNGPLRDRVLAGSDYPMMDPGDWNREFQEIFVPRLKPGLEGRITEANAGSFLGP